MARNSTMVLYGKHGCGKSTMLDLLRSQGWITLTMSDILKSYVEDESDTDPKVCEIIRECMQQRAYVPDEITNGTLNHYMFTRYPPKRTSNKKFVFDGHPRTASQVKFLMHLMHDEYHVGRRASSVFMEVRLGISFERQFSRALNTGRGDASEENMLQGALNHLRNEAEVKRALLEMTNNYEIDANPELGAVRQQMMYVVEQEESRIHSINTESVHVPALA